MNSAPFEYCSIEYWRRDIYSIGTMNQIHRAPSRTANISTLHTYIHTYLGHTMHFAPFSLSISISYHITRQANTLLDILSLSLFLFLQGEIHTYIQATERYMYETHSFIRFSRAYLTFSKDLSWLGMQLLHRMKTDVYLSELHTVASQLISLVKKKSFVS